MISYITHLYSKRIPRPMLIDMFPKFQVHSMNLSVWCDICTPCEDVFAVAGVTKS